MIDSIIENLSALREYYLKNGQTEAAQGVLSAIALLEDYRVDTGATMLVPAADREGYIPLGEEYRHKMAASRKEHPSTSE